jgi:hypothetical protein
MKVFYDGHAGNVTYHPQMGRLIAWKVFEPKDVGMTEEQIRVFVESGLLKDTANSGGPAGQIYTGTVPKDKIKQQGPGAGGQGSAKVKSNKPKKN